MPRTFVQIRVKREDKIPNISKKVDLNVFAAKTHHECKVAHIGELSGYALGSCVTFAWGNSIPPSIPRGASLRPRYRFLR